MGVLRDAELDQNQGADPAERPSIRVEADLYWSILQTPKITLAVPKLLGPYTDSCTTDAHLARDGHVGKVASSQQSTGF